MKQKFLIDTNIIIRIITKDPKNMWHQTEELIQKVENEEIIFYIPSMVVAESYWVLKSIYGMSQSEIYQGLSSFFQSEGIQMEEPWIINALKDSLVHNVDFIDAYISKKAQTSFFDVLTWNKKHFKRLDCEFYTPGDLINP
ncbi:MAG TPA: PIN domain-containing protein [Bacillales bacterium]